MNFFSSGAFFFGMLSIALMILVYKLDKHDDKSAARRAARAKAQRIRELQALAMERSGAVLRALGGGRVMEEMRMMIAQRLSYWRSRLDKAEGRYHSSAQSISEQQRQGYLAECKVCQAVLAELELLREEVVEHGEKN